MLTVKSVGMTGTRAGLTEMQKLWLVEFLESTLVNVLHHGDCIGADDQVASTFSVAGTYIIAHPGNSESLRANCKKNDLVLPWKANLTRNADIVNAGSLMLAFPGSQYPIEHSGTWQTINYTKKRKKDLCIVFPNGLVVRNDNNDDAT